MRSMPCNRALFKLHSRALSKEDGSLCNTVPVPRPSPCVSTSLSKCGNLITLLLFLPFFFVLESARSCVNKPAVGGQRRIGRACEAFVSAPQHSADPTPQGNGLHVDPV